MPFLGINYHTSSLCGNFLTLEILKSEYFHHHITLRHTQFAQEVFHFRKKILLKDITISNPKYLKHKHPNFPPTYTGLSVLSHALGAYCYRKKWISISLEHKQVLFRQW